MQRFAERGSKVTAGGIRGTKERVKNTQKQVYPNSTALEFHPDFLLPFLIAKPLQGKSNY